MVPKPGETIADPACGTGGFLLAAHDYISHHYDLDRDEKRFLRDKAFHGIEIVDNTARLCAMNLFLHGIGGDDPDATPPIDVRDALLAEPSEKVDLVLANPPFGKKSSITIIGEDGSASQRSATICPSRLLGYDSQQAAQLPSAHSLDAEDRRPGRGRRPRQRSLRGRRRGDDPRAAAWQDCDVHTLLRLPTGIFYAQGVKANVIFFERRAASVRAGDEGALGLRLPDQPALHPEDQADEARGSGRVR